MKPAQYLVQTRTHGEAWKTRMKTGDLVEAEAYGAQLAAEKLSSVYGFESPGTPWCRNNWVRIVHGKDQVVLWVHGQRIAPHAAVAS